MKYNGPKCHNRIVSGLMKEPVIHFLNTTIVPAGADGTWTVETVDPLYVRHGMLMMLASDGRTDFAESHIGHEATAQAASELFGQRLPMDRTPWDGSGIGVALQLRGRLEEGKILNREDLERVGYTVRVIFREGQGRGTL